MGRGTFVVEIKPVGSVSQRLKLGSANADAVMHAPSEHDCTHLGPCDAAPTAYCTARARNEFLTLLQG